MAYIDKLLFCSGMSFVVLFLEFFERDMSIYLCSSKRGVSLELFYGIEFSSVV